ncbi:hypothetical protein JDV02_004162 [Purpureocillium takamizusanense]|uniref:N-acetyltransferase domain-containing protein n=1 Tax=Purpureocillium takamizusanense TaxID=2060973 RepID=A0A9Q8QE67_9HYPO|nr:uncharacterized protein JDV02_004162 [Purpureocillium takamizusanense]UNI17848.1 hypothetical protein JDV02_004162 [Purpureocillium takamizusanense]
MALHLRPATEVDIADIVDVALAAFDPRVDAVTRNLFPGLQARPPGAGDQQQGLRQWSVARKSSRLHVKRSVMMVAVDAEDVVVGYSMWFAPARNGDDDECEPLPRPKLLPFEGLDGAALARLRQVMEDDARETFGEQGSENVWNLDSLGVHPRHQRKGVGRLLLDWGTQQAEAEGKDCYLVATPAGVPLYRAANFESTRTVDIFGTPHVSMIKRCA